MNSKHVGVHRLIENSANITGEHAVDKKSLYTYIEILLAGRSSNGRTADSESAYRGSNPCLPAKPFRSKSSRTHGSSLLQRPTQRTGQWSGSNLIIKSFQFGRRGY